MISVKCMCGKSTLNFYKPIDTYYGECCKLAGLDHFGKPTKEVVQDDPMSEGALEDAPKKNKKNKESKQ